MHRCPPARGRRRRGGAQLLPPPPPPLHPNIAPPPWLAAPAAHARRSPLVRRGPATCVGPARAQCRHVCISGNPTNLRPIAGRCCVHARVVCTELCMGGPAQVPEARGRGHTTGGLLRPNARVLAYGARASPRRRMNISGRGDEAHTSAASRSRMGWLGAVLSHRVRALLPCPCGARGNNKRGPVGGQSWCTAPGGAGRAPRETAARFPLPPLEEASPRAGAHASAAAGWRGRPCCGPRLPAICRATYRRPYMHAHICTTSTAGTSACAVWGRAQHFSHDGGKGAPPARRPARRVQRVWWRTASASNWI